MRHARAGLTRLLTMLAGFTLAQGVSTACGATIVRLEARSLYKRAVTRNLRFSADALALELDEGELFEDDGPAAGYSDKPNEEILSPDTWIKKVLLIPRPRARAATLLVAPGGDLRAIINGRRYELGTSTRVGNYWQAYSLHSRALRRGRNDIVPSGSGKVWISRDDEFAQGSRERKHHPNRSARSTDRGKTWDDEHLGSAATDGEYYVRVFLEHYRPRGSLTLPVIDLGNLGNKALGKPVVSAGPVRISVEANTGRTGRIAVQVRSGTTYVPRRGSWSQWHTLPETGGVLENPSGRYLQAAFGLSTGDPLETPRLKNVTVEARPQRPGVRWTETIRVLENHNEEILRTSIPFPYEPFDHPRLKTLRRRYELDTVIRGARSEFDLIILLARWASTRFTRDHFRDGYPPWDALEILKPHADGSPVGGFCLQHNLVLLQACESFGISGRIVSIGPGDLTGVFRGGHEAIELWSNEFKKWVYVDGSTASYAVDKTTEQPLSLLELRQRQLSTLCGKQESPTALVKIAEGRYTWSGLKTWPPFVELRLIPRSSLPGELPGRACRGLTLEASRRHELCRYCLEGQTGHVSRAEAVKIVRNSCFAI